MRRASRRDITEPAIVAALREAGYKVAQISHPGLPDLLVWRTGVPHFVLIECKSMGGELTKQQLQFWTDSAGTPRFVIYDPESALKVCETWIDLRGRGNGSGDANV